MRDDRVSQAIYPTIIIFVVTLNRSVIESSLLNAGSPSAIPTYVLPDLVLGSDSSAAHMLSSNSSDHSHAGSAGESA